MADKEIVHNLHGEDDLESLLLQKERLEAIIREKYTKILTIMFTDLKGSTGIAEAHGDFRIRMLLKYHNDIVLPTIREFNGTFVKSIGDGTLSYFQNAQDALRAAVSIQRALDAFNKGKTITTPILMRIGLHTGRVLVEKHDISGDVVNTASRFESVAGECEIYLSEVTVNALSDKDETACRYIKTVTFRGKQDPVKIFKAYWNPEETHVEVTDDEASEESGVSTKVQVAAALTILMVIIVILLLFMRGPKDEGAVEQEKRTIRQAVEEPLKK
ncbi:MAG: adenylate/guanylate cyclase domain-containing protein [Nitrospinae bacterium]|nr:adenylate/guanylate cyclase domain-containing protein [Nitrospinota bacterium]